MCDSLCDVGVVVCGMVVSHILEDLYNLARSSGPPVVGIWDRSTTSKFEVCNNVVHTHTHTHTHTSAR